MLLIMIRRRVLVPALALAAALMLPGLAHAKKGEGKHQKRVAKMCEKIQCSDQQEREIGQVFQQMHIDTKADRAAIKDLRKQMADEWAKDRPSEATLESLAKKVAAHEQNIADRRMDAMMELHGVLDAEQRKQVAAQLMKGKDGKGKEGKGKKAKKAKKAKQAR